MPPADDNPPDRDIVELLRERIRQIDSGEDKGTPANEVFAELRSELLSRVPKEPK